MKLTKTTALKGALLMVLAANVSWEHLEIGSSQLASTEAVKAGAGAASAPAASASAPISQSPEATKVKVNGDAPKAVTVAAAKADPLGEPTVSKLSQPAESYMMDICETPYRVRFKQFEEEGVTKTEVIANLASGANAESEVRFTKSVPLLQAIDPKGPFSLKLKKDILETRKAMGQSCGKEVAATTTTEVPAKDAKKHETNEELAQDIKNCKVDKKGEALKKSEQIDCWTDAIEHADKRVAKKGENGKRISEEALSKAVLAEVQKGQKELKRLLKSELLSSDESRVEDAKEALTSAMDAIEEISASYDLGTSKRSGRSTNEVSKLIGELSALKQGAETREKAEDMKERVVRGQRDFRESKENLNSAYRTAMEQPLDWQARMAWEQSKREYFETEQEFNMMKYNVTNQNGDFQQQYIRPLKQFQSSRLISAEDYRDFTSPFTDIEKLLRQSFGRDSALSGGRGGQWGSPVSSSDIPSGLASRRNGGVVSSIGLSPTAPTLTLPAMSSSYPTSSFSPLTTGRH